MNSEQPFERYVHRVLAHVPQLTPEQAGHIRAELRTHLEDAAADVGDSPDAPEIQAQVIKELGSSRRVGRELAKTYRRRRTPAQIRLLAVTIMRAIVATLATLTFLLFGLGTLMVVPPPSDTTAVEVSGRLTRLGRPHPELGDLSIHLDGGRSYYVNRANEVEYFDWQRMHREVEVGDKVYLTVVRPLAWRIGSGSTPPSNGPVAGVRTDTTIYMDSSISAATWPGLHSMRNTTIAALLVLVVCASPELRRALQRPPTATAA